MSGNMYYHRMYCKIFFFFLTLYVKCDTPLCGIIAAKCSGQRRVNDHITEYCSVDK